MMSAGFRIEQTSDRKLVLSVYEALGYRRGIAFGDTVWLAQASREPIGIVRVAPEFGVLVLRGMRIAEQWQRHGIGTKMLHAVSEWLGRRSCCCVPYAHLVGFYSQIGSAEITPEAAPAFLAERLTDYRQQGLNVTLMARLSP